MLIVIPAPMARYKLADSPLFELLRQQEQIAAMPSLGVFKRYGAPVALLALVMAFSYMDGYATRTYFISFMRFAGIPLTTTAIILLCSRIGDILVCFKRALRKPLQAQNCHIHYHWVDYSALISLQLDSFGPAHCPRDVAAEP